jgi:hypothetical protein
MRQRSGFLRVCGVTPCGAPARRFCQHVWAAGVGLGVDQGEKRRMR